MSTEPKTGTPTQTGMASFETRDGVEGVNLYGPEYPMDQPEHGMYRCGYWRPLSAEEMLIRDAARAEVAEAVMTEIVIPEAVPEAS